MSIDESKELHQLAYQSRSDGRAQSRSRPAGDGGAKLFGQVVQFFGALFGAMVAVASIGSRNSVALGIVGFGAIVGILTLLLFRRNTNWLLIGGLLGSVLGCLIAGACGR